MTLFLRARHSSFQPLWDKHTFSLTCLEGISRVTLFSRMRDTNDEIFFPFKATRTSFRRSSRFYVFIFFLVYFYFIPFFSPQGFFLLRFVLSSGLEQQQQQLQTERRVILHRLVVANECIFRISVSLFIFERDIIFFHTTRRVIKKDLKK